MVTVREFSSRIEAEVAKGLLEQSGIFSSILADDQGGMNPMLAFARGVSLQVAEKDLEPSKRLLDEALQAAEDSKG